MVTSQTTLRWTTVDQKLVEDICTPNVFVVKVIDNIESTPEELDQETRSVDERRIKFSKRRERLTILRW